MKVYACVLGLICLASVKVSVAAQTLDRWPMDDSNRGVTRNFGTYQQAAGGYHYALDIYGERGVQYLIAVETMTIRRVLPLTGDPAQIDCEFTANGTICTAVFAHIEQLSGQERIRFTPNRVIGKGVRFAKVRSGVPPHTGNLGSFPHCHFEINKNGVRENPLILYGNIDPPISSPEKVAKGPIFFRNTATGTYNQWPNWPSQNVVYGAVDIVAELVDRLGKTQNGSTTESKYGKTIFAGRAGVPYKVRYRIDGPNGSAKDDGGNYFTLVENKNQSSVAGSNLPELFDQSFQISNTNGAYSYSYTLTNAPPSGDTINDGYSWNTKIRSGENDNDVANGTDQLARINAEAKYPDGKYTLTILADDLQHSDNKHTHDVLLDNFAPYVNAVRNVVVLPQDAILFIA